MKHLNTNVFSNKELTVTYEPCKCINAGKCAEELSEVFRQSVIPWIDLDAEPSEKIINQVKKCPSGALSYFKNMSQDVA